MLIRFWPPKWFQNDSKMEPKLSSGRSLGSLVDSKGLQGAQETPKASKMEPQRPQNGPLETPNASKLNPGTSETSQNWGRETLCTPNEANRLPERRPDRQSDRPDYTTDRHPDKQSRLLSDLFKVSDFHDPLCSCSRLHDAPCFEF